MSCYFFCRGFQWFALKRQPAKCYAKTKWHPQKSFLLGFATFRTPSTPLCHFQVGEKIIPLKTYPVFRLGGAPWKIRPASFSAQAEIHWQQQARRIHRPAAVMGLHRQGIHARWVELHRVPRRGRRSWSTKHAASANMQHLRRCMCTQLSIWYVYIYTRVCVCMCLCIYRKHILCFYVVMYVFRLRYGDKHM
jgi:hypothetical protein